MIEELTYREEQIYNLAVTTPLKAPQIAEKLKIKAATVRTYLNNIFLKLGINSREELIILHYKNLIKNNYQKFVSEESKNG